MTCQTCRLPLPKMTARNGHKDCWTCRRLQTQRERVKGMTQVSVGRIVGETLAKFYKLPTAEQGERA